MIHIYKRGSGFDKSVNQCPLFINLKGLSMTLAILSRKVAPMSKSAASVRRMRATVTHPSKTTHCASTLKPLASGLSSVLSRQTDLPPRLPSTFRLFNPLAMVSRDLLALSWEEPRPLPVPHDLLLTVVPLLLWSRKQTARTKTYSSGYHRQHIDCLHTHKAEQWQLLFVEV
jgi:hypothetical protein